MKLDDILPARPDDLTYRQLSRWFDMYGSEYAHETYRVWRQRLTHFHNWCANRGAPWLPSNAETLLEYIREIRGSAAPSTVAVTISVLSAFHERAGSFVCSRNLELSRARQEIEMASKESLKPQIRAEELSVLTRRLGDTPLEKWVRAAIWFVYDTRFRTQDLVDVTLDELYLCEGNVGWVPPPKKPTKWTRSGAYLAETTMAYIESWVSSAGIAHGPLLAKVTKTGRIRTDDLSGLHFRACLKEGLDFAGIRSRNVNFKNIRNGSIADLETHNVGVFRAMRFGRWARPESVWKYTEGMRDTSTLQLAEIQGR